MKKFKKLLKAKTFWVIIVILIIVLALIIRSARTGQQVEYTAEEVRLGDIVQTVSATGQVKSASEIQLNFRNSGQLAILKVDTGDEVKAGDILAQLKATDLQIDVNRALADLQEAQANLDKVTAGATASDIAVSEAAVAKSQTDLITAQDDLVNIEKIYSQALENAKQDLLTDINIALSKAGIALREINDTFNYEGSDNNFNTSNINLENKVIAEKDAAGEMVVGARADYQLAKASPSDSNLDQSAVSALEAMLQTELALDDMSQLLGYVIITPTLTQTELDGLQSTMNTQYTTVDTNLSAVQTADQDLLDARINYQTKVDAAQNVIKTAEKNLAKAQADLDLKKSPSRPEDVSLYQARLRRAQSSLSLTQDKYDETILKAPIDGVVTEINFEVGEQTSLSEPVIRMLAKEDFEIEVDIPESDIAKLSVGDASMITLDAFTDEDIFDGVVITINPAQTEIQDVVYYKLTVGFATSQPAKVIGLIEKIKPGMTANVDVKTDERRNVLIIPYRAVKERNGLRVVEILVDQQSQEVTVQIGLRGDEGLVEVVDGLSAGQQVITFTQGN